MIRAGPCGRSGAQAEPLPFAHGPIAAGRAARNVHAPLQHRADRLDAGVLPGPPRRARRTAGRRVRRRPVRRDVLPGRARPVAVVRHHLRPLRPPPDHGLRAGLRRDRGHPHRPRPGLPGVRRDRHARHPRRHARPRGRLERRERAVDPGLHRDGDRGRRGPARQDVGPLRGGHAGRPRPRRHRRGQAVRVLREPRDRAGGLLPQRRVLRRVVPDLHVRRQRPARRGGGPGRRARPRRSLSRPDPVVARPAAGADLDRHQRGPRRVAEPVGLPAGQGRREVPEPDPDGWLHRQPDHHRGDHHRRHLRRRACCTGATSSRRTGGRRSSATASSAVPPWSWRASS